MPVCSAHQIPVVCIDLEMGSSCRFVVAEQSWIAYISRFESISEHAEEVSIGSALSRTF